MCRSISRLLQGQVKSPAELETLLEDLFFRSAAERPHSPLLHQTLLKPAVLSGLMAGPCQISYSSLVLQYKHIQAVPSKVGKYQSLPGRGTALNSLIEESFW